MTAITGKTVLITGANRGIGRALLDEALRRGAQRVYAGTRESFAHPDERVTPLLLEVTDAAQTQQAAQTVPSLDILVNNAGVALFPDSMSQTMAAGWRSSPAKALEREYAAIAATERARVLGPSPM